MPQFQRPTLGIHTPAGRRADWWEVFTSQNQSCHSWLDRPPARDFIQLGAASELGCSPDHICKKRNALREHRALNIYPCQQHPWNNPYRSKGDKHCIVITLCLQELKLHWYALGAWVGIAGRWDFRDTPLTQTSCAPGQCATRITLWDTFYCENNGIKL